MRSITPGMTFLSRWGFVPCLSIGYPLRAMYAAGVASRADVTVSRNAPAYAVKRAPTTVLAAIGGPVCASRTAGSQETCDAAVARAYRVVERVEPTCDEPPR
jgi:hypothetical protein